VKYTYIGLFVILTSFSMYATDHNNGRAPKQKHCKHLIRSKACSKQSLRKKGLFTKPNYHLYYINTIDLDGSLITTKDGTVWQISPKTAHTALGWSQEDPIIISTNRWWFSSYKYGLINQKRKEEVEANLTKGPLEGNSVSIEYIDPQNGYICLTDGSKWQLDRSSEIFYLHTSRGAIPIEITSHIYRWRAGQKVLQGKSYSWLGRSYILINTDENNHLSATLLNTK